MNQDPELQQMKEELLQLNQQLIKQQQQLSYLYGQLQKRTGAVGKPTAHSSPSAFSLENFIGLKLIHLVGIIVLVIGLSIGVKLAIDKNLISELARIGLAYAAGILLFVLSLKLRPKYHGFSAILFSGGMASLYFTTYGAHVYYHFIPFALAFLLMALFTVFTVWQALSYNREEIALLGLVGAYAIPFLISSNADKVVLFFIYVSVINIGVLYLGIRKPWRILGKAANAITWLIFISWAALESMPPNRFTGIFFLLLFFCIFQLIAIRLSWVKKEAIPQDNLVQILFNHLAFYIGSLIVFSESNQDLSAWVTLACAGLFALEAWIFQRLWKNSGVQVGLGTMAYILFVAFIAMHWENMSITLIWLALSIITFSFGVYYRISRPRIMAIILMGVTLLKLLMFDSLRFTTVQKVIAYILLGALLLLVSFLYQRFKSQIFGKEEKENKR